MNQTFISGISSLGMPPQVRRSRRMGSSVLLFFMLLTILGCLPLAETVGAEETTQEEFPDRLKLYGGYQLMFGIDGKFRFDGSKTGFGSTLDFDDDLGGDENDKMLRAGATFRLNPNHAIGFSWYDINLSGERTLDDDLQIDDKIFQIGGQIKSKIDLTLYRLFYNWSFYHSDKTELTLSPGMYFGDFEAKFKGNAVIDAEEINQISKTRRVKENLFAPLPTIGLAVAYKIFPRLTANLRTDFFYVDISEVKGSMAELFIGLEYRVFKHFAVGAAYDRMLVDVEYKNGKPKGWELDISWNSGLFYGALYF